MDLLEQFVRRHARRTTQNGQVVIVTNGDALLLEAFKQLGWSDPYPDPELLPPSAPVASRGTKATVEDPERAVLPRPKGRTSGRR
jgi:hypothetical protein